MIDHNGIPSSRKVGEKVNSVIYHMVLYQAIDNKLRVVYSKIIKKLKVIQLRDRDARQLLRTSDYELITEVLTKFSCKLNLGEYYPLNNPISYSYRKYNPAYFEEILLDQKKILERTANNYRDLYLRGSDTILKVL
mmetsp:Transcript_38788/g.58968  ORF Transcript_38788/g.58968 Transcript_38788/m.58968 type:complete len:136 (-) Transcript_38788:122-529(-)